MTPSICINEMYDVEIAYNDGSYRIVPEITSMEISEKETIISMRDATECYYLFMASDIRRIKVFNIRKRG